MIVTKPYYLPGRKPRPVWLTNVLLTVLAIGAVIFLATVVLPWSIDRELDKREARAPYFWARVLDSDRDTLTSERGAACMVRLDTVLRDKPTEVTK